MHACWICNMCADVANQKRRSKCAVPARAPWNRSPNEKRVGWTIHLLITSHLTSPRGSQFTWKVFGVAICFRSAVCLSAESYFETHLGTTARNAESRENFYFSSWFSAKAAQKNVCVCARAHMSERSHQ